MFNIGLFIILAKEVRIEGYPKETGARLPASLAKSERMLEDTSLPVRRQLPSLHRDSQAGYFANETISGRLQLTKRLKSGSRSLARQDHGSAMYGLSLG